MRRLLIELGQRGDTAEALIKTLMRAVKGKQHMRGRDLIALLGDRLNPLLQLTSNSSFIQPRRAPSTDVRTLSKQFLGRIAEALGHDQTHPNTLLAYEDGEWIWYDKRPFLPTARSAAVIVLDGSARELVYQQLCAPWSTEFVLIDVPIAPSVKIVQCRLTQSTRKIIADESRLRSVMRAVAGTCVKLGLVLEGGISYLKATEYFAKNLGADWLHYGALRGRNDFANREVIAIVASPTMPPRAIERKAMALWSDDTYPIACDWQRVGHGEYTATEDPRLQAVNELHGPEELCQAAHRLRLIRRNTPATLLIFSPWNLDRFGLTPHQEVDEIPYGNSRAARQGYEEYTQLRTSRLKADRGEALPQRRRRTNSTRSNLEYIPVAVV